MGGSKLLNLNQMISNAMKTNNQQERIRRYMTSREEAVHRCVNSLIHTLNCREGATCRAHGCQKMKRVVEHTKTCPRRNANFKGCAICTQLMNLCFYHSKLCRANVCHVPFCRIMKRKLQALNELYAQKQSIQTMKPVLQFPIPPLQYHLPSLFKTSSSSSASSDSPATTPERRNSSDASESLPKRIRLEESDSSLANHNLNNNEAQNSNNVINNVFNGLILHQIANAQEPQTAEVEVA